MSNLKEIRSRIVSVNSTKQITSAMKMVSAAKLKRAQDAVTQIRPYASKLKKILVNLSTSIDTEEGIYSQIRDVKNVLLVVVTSNRGLCGGFNANIIKATNFKIKEYAGANISVVTIGKKATEFFKKTDGASLLSSHDDIYNGVSYAKASIIAEFIMKEFAEKKIDKVEFVYNHFKNAASQEVITEDYLPVVKKIGSEKEANIDYIFQPSQQEIVESLIPKSLKTQLYKGILDSIAAEHGARMTAMHKATDNATELIKELKLTYNKARQASITNEILEIVAGAEALNG